MISLLKVSSISFVSTKKSGSGFSRKRSATRSLGDDNRYVPAYFTRTSEYGYTLFFLMQHSGHRN